jgi:hypothetical protein
MKILWQGPLECKPGENAYDGSQNRYIGPKMAIHLLGLWRKEGYDADLFKGESTEQERLTNDHFQATLTGDQDQFRIWTGYRFHMSEEEAEKLCGRDLPSFAFYEDSGPFFHHVDSCGSQCLLSIHETAKPRTYMIKEDAKKFITEACMVLGLDHAFHLGSRFSRSARLFLPSDDPNIGPLEDIAMDIGEKIAKGKAMKFTHESAVHLYKNDLMRDVYVPFLGC